LYKSLFSARDQHVLSIPHWAHHFTAIISKVHEFVQNRVSSPTSARFLIAALGTPLLSDFQQSAPVWRSSARFVILAPGTPLFSHFQQSARVCGKQRFQPETRTFRHFRTVFTTC